ncbi:5-formyltetrahydrofolate cyclo-ligase, partial [Xanthomonas oryzae pv. oryzae]
MTEDRDALRRQLRAHRRSLPAPTRLAAADALAERLLALPFAPHSGAVAGYWAMDGEIALHRWQLTLPARVRYCLPVLDGRVLRFAPWRPGQPLVSNRYGIPEPDVDRAATLAPEEMALVITPLTGFDGACRRL